MTVSPPEVASLIDLDRYPIHDLDGAHTRALPLSETSRTVSRTLSVVPHGAPCHRDMLRDPQKPEVQP